jgi:hypothetical protein
MSYLSCLNYLNCSGALVTDQAAKVKVKEEAGSVLKMGYSKMKKLVEGSPRHEVETENDFVNPRSLPVGDGEAHLRHQTPRMEPPEQSSLSLSVAVHRLVAVDRRSSSYKSHNPRPMLPLRLQVRPPIPLVGPLNCFVSAPRLLAERFLAAQFFA